MKPYLQSTPFTTAASALLSILHHQKTEIELSQDNEFSIWRASALLPTRASCIYALASYAKKKGVGGKVVVEKKDYDFPDYRFYRYTKEDIGHAATNAAHYLKTAQEEGVEIEERKITLEEIKELLKEGKILLLRLNVKPLRDEKRNTSNYVVVFGYSNGNYAVVDPQIGEIKVSEELMQTSFETLETKKHRDHRMIIF